MAKQHAFVTALWLQELAAGFAARMRNNPWLILRIYRLFTETFVRSWNLILIIFHTAFWAVIIRILLYIIIYYYILLNRGFDVLFMKDIPGPDRCDSFSPFAVQTVVDPV